MTPAEAKAELWYRGVLFWKVWDHQKPLYAFFQELDGATHKQRLIEIARQWGKTYLACIVALETALKGKRVQFISSTGKSLRMFVIPRMDDVMLDMPKELMPAYNSVDGVYRFKNGGMIALAGADGIALRGPANDLVLIDEAGFIDELDGLIKNVVLPSLLVTRGRMVVLSSTAESPGHHFTDLCDLAELEGRYFKRTIWDNPTVTKSEIAEWAHEAGCELNGEEIVKKTTSWLREYECVRVIESSRAVVPEWTKELGERVAKKIRPPDAHEQRYTVLDPGGRDPHGILAGYYDFKRAKLCIERETLLRQSNTAGIANAIAEIEKPWGAPPFRRVIDGGADSLVLADLQTVHQLGFLPTQKDDKEAAVNKLRLWLVGGRVEIDPRCKNLLHQLGGTLWNKARTSYERTQAGGHGDLLDCLVYLVRNLSTENPYYGTEYDHLPKDETTFVVPAVEAPRDRELAEVFAPSWQQY